jgi:hypothetical protein
MPASAVELKDFAPVESATVQTVVLPGTGYTVAPRTLHRRSGSSLGGLQQAIAAWLSSEFGLPPVEEMPAVSFASKRGMLALRYRNVPTDRRAAGPQPSVDSASDIVADNDSRVKTIYLPDGWSGTSPIELSMLVHEMVHHMQHLAGMRFGCPQEREEMAFAAQERWLRLFGRDLLTDFGLDPLTLLVRTKCF